MRSWTLIAMALACTASAAAQAPPADRSRALFAGEWAGIGEGGSHCYLKLDPNGRGWALIDAGAGNLLGAQLRWRNQNQSLQVDELTPVLSSPSLRTMPLTKLSLVSGFNRSLRLDWHAPSGTCQIQRTDVATHQLSQAREVLEQLQRDAGEP